MYGIHDFLWYGTIALQWAIGSSGVAIGRHVRAEVLLSDSLELTLPFDPSNSWHVV